MPLEPLIKRRYAAFRAQGIPRGEPTPEGRRADAARAAAEAWEELGLPVPDVEIERAEVAVPGDFPDVGVRIHRPPGAAGPLPAVVTFFGGAFRMGSNDFGVNRWNHARRALDAEVAVVAVDYALAPEHKFPTQIEQGLAVLDWVFERAGDLGIDPERVAVSGQSSGANIAAACAQWNLDRAAHPLRLQLLEVPTLDLTGRHIDLKPLRQLRIPKFFFTRDLKAIRRDYLPPGQDAADPRVSPLLRADLRGLPPTVILASEYDPLHGDALAYWGRLREAQVPASATVAAGQTHEAAGFVGALLSAQMAHAQAVAALRSLHDPASPGAAE
ncbi:MAG: alpha/beta hydrolase [Bifidobacteriaceae bacterium]|jgi:acetyl esterase|nr:alpha/beta hydrolase [Bifidobacteriaceae bacterium]